MIEGLGLDGRLTVIQPCGLCAGQGRPQYERPGEIHMVQVYKCRGCGRFFSPAEVEQWNQTAGSVSYALPHGLSELDMALMGGGPYSTLPCGGFLSGGGITHGPVEVRCPRCAGRREQTLSVTLGDIAHLLQESNPAP